MSLLLDALKKSGAAEMRKTPAPQRSSSDAIQTNRTAGGNLFSVKQAFPQKLFRSSFIGLAIVASGIMAAGAGYYFHIETSMPEQSLLPAPPSLAIAHVNTPHPAATSAPATSSETKPTSNTLPSEPKQPSNHAHRMPDEEHKAPVPSVTIQRQEKAGAIDLILTSAYESYQKGDYAIAWQRYTEAHSIEPDNRDALLGLAVIAQQQGDDETALSYYRHVLLLDPRDPIAHAGLSGFSSGSLAGKESRLKQLISQQPDSAALYFALGKQYFEHARWSDAQQAYFIALTMEPGNALFAFNLAISLDHLGQHKVAARYYQQAIQLSPYEHVGFNRASIQQRLIELSAAGE